MDKRFVKDIEQGLDKMLGFHAVGECEWHPKTDPKELGERVEHLKDIQSRI